MDNQISAELAAAMDQINGHWDRAKAVLALLLDDRIKHEDALFVEAARMGGSPSYIASTSLEWIRNHVRLANTMPLLKRSLDPETGKLRIDEESIEIISQRAIDWSREAVLAKYLIERDNHKFPPILVVLGQPWVDDPTSDMWDEDGAARETSTTFEALDGQGRVGMLELGPTSSLYVFDGQHRLIGIAAALHLITYGRLDVRDREGNVKRDEALVLDDLVEEHGLDETRLQQLGAERMGVEIIPAVIRGETRADAQRRVRSIFTHVNKQASPLTKGEVAQLDEDNGFAIVARRIAVEHPLFKTGRNAVNFKNSTITKRSAHLTTLQTLTEMAKRYLTADESYAGWNAKGRELARRPVDEELVRGRADFKELWDHIADLPTFRGIASGQSPSRYRRFEHEVEKGSGGGRGYMLLRPIGQQALGQAVGVMRAEGVSWDDIFAKVAAMDGADGLRLDFVGGPWWGVLYDFNGQRINTKGLETAVKLLCHLIAGLPTDRDRRALRELVADARSVGEDEFRDYNGEIVPRSKIALPAPW
ncbi:DGQHR domain-containing protein [Embleya scabrispora]|uniref:DGQHR domain-containing protein n=1 Tax=Embleya scabrispora TaxID=159449 RepID=UPI0004764D40|nr:DGQHR domain-containing protein [Embleya scabrispora]MYS87881.1 DGQHR domain-containing protein [Streptomyces sp. SID5474]